MMNTVTERRVERIIAKYKALGNYPNTKLAQSPSVLLLSSTHMETRVYYVSQTGYDTHANQLNNHQRLLSELSAAMSAFQDDLNAHGKDDQVLTMTFSEFGRRPAENGSGGTDHGTAAPLFVMGSKVKGGLLGSTQTSALAKRRSNMLQIFVAADIIDKWLEATLVIS